MNKIKSILMSGLILIALGIPCSTMAAEQDLLQRIEQLSKELETLKQQVKKNEEKSKDIEIVKQQVKKQEDKSLSRWLEVSGDYRFRYDNLRGQVAPYADGLTLFGNVGTLMSAMGSGKIAPMTQPALFGAAINGGTFGTGASAFAIPTAKRDAFDVKNDALY